VHPVPPTPIKALVCLCFSPPMAEKNKPPALRVIGDAEHYYGKRYKPRTGMNKKTWLNVSIHTEKKNQASKSQVETIQWLASNSHFGDIHFGSLFGGDGVGFFYKSGSSECPNP
jgi:hypothetical protein